MAALKLLQRVQELNYLVLECLAERTLADHYQIMMSGGDGYDSQNRCFLLLHCSNLILKFNFCKKFLQFLTGYICCCLWLWKEELA